MAMPWYSVNTFIMVQSLRTSTQGVKGRTIREVMGGGGGWGKKQKKIRASENAKKLIHAKKKVKKKILAEGRSKCDFFRKSEFQNSTILPGTI